VLIVLFVVLINSIILDMITNIKNSNIIKANKVKIFRTSLTLEIAKILKKEGFISSIEEDSINSSSYFQLVLKYKGINRKPYISGLKRISTLGLRVYVRKKKIPQVLGGIGVAIRLLYDYIIKFVF
jgi:small subunit ribosomal protein S8